LPKIGNFLKKTSAHQVHKHGRPQALEPLAGQNSMFLGVFFRQIVCFAPPPWKILPSPGKKSADAHVHKVSI